MKEKRNKEKWKRLKERNAFAGGFWERFSP